MLKHNVFIEDTLKDSNLIVIIIKGYVKFFIIFIFNIKSVKSCVISTD